MAIWMPTQCEWCKGVDIDEPDYHRLCRSHQAEYEGLSENELDRADAIELSEWLDTQN
jgi:hypothetical protein